MIEWQPFGQKSLDFIYRPINKDARINILEGSVRSSKTVTMIPKWIRYIKEGPPGLLVMTGVSKDTIYDNVLRDLFDTVGTKSYKYNRQNGELRMYGRDIKVIGAKDEGAEKYLRGKTLAGAYSDELTLLPEKFFKQLLNRLSVKGSKLYGTTNPDTPSHYIYTEYIIDPEKLESGMVDVIHFMLDDNPNLDDEYKQFITKAYSGLFYKRFILGQWVMGEGAIYDMFTDECLVDDDFLLPGHFDKASRYIAIDYGTQNATVFLDILDTGREVYVINEWYHSGRSTGIQKTDSQYADELHDFIAGRRIDRIILDPSAASFRAELRKRGHRIKDADNEVLDGIRLVGSMFSTGQLKIHKRCKNLIREIQSYVWDTNPTEKGNEKPVKKDDHGPDALRYFCKTIVKKLREYGV